MYLHVVSDMSSKLLFRFRSGTHGLNEELGRHSTRKSRVFCDCGSESVEHVLWECSEYSSFVRNLLAILRGFYKRTFV